MGLWEKIKKMQGEDYAALCKIVLTFLPGKLLRRKKPDLWLISERRFDARDNGYWLFRYIREKDPEKEVYYPIDPASPDYSKVEQLGHVIPFGSMKHHLYLWACHKHISAHIGNGLPNGHICFNLLMWGCYSFQNIFLQHGITQNRPPFLLKENNRLDLFVCACQRETDFVRKELGYSEREARCLGFCRYDNLSVRPADASPAEPSGSLKGAPEDGTAADGQYNPRQILIMPTWRSWLFTDQKKEFAQNQADFLQSEYCRQYRALLDHPSLRRLAEEQDLEIVFFLHNDMQQFLDAFRPDNPRVRIVGREGGDVQALLKSAAFLVTDYSSIAFDFAYMYKPMVYFQFDQERFREGQYPSGYFRYEADGFGPVVKTVDEVIETVADSWECRFSMQPPYTQRVDGFFTWRDRENCKRVYEAIEEL